MIDKAFHMPGMTAAGLPSGTQPFADMSQGLTWMQNMWSSYMNSPMAPTLDIDELDRRIKDLKAVEQWLSVNQTLLRSTIQGLEIQRAGIAGFRSMMESQHESTDNRPSSATAPVGNPTTPGHNAAASGHNAAASGHNAAASGHNAAASVDNPAAPGQGHSEHPAMEQANQWWGFLQKQFEQLASKASLTPTPETEQAAAASGTQASRMQANTAERDRASDHSGQPKKSKRQTKIPQQKTPSRGKPGAFM
jgi:hypothetical protein